MKVGAFVMAWPVWSETSVIREMKKVSEDPGCDLDIMALRPLPGQADQTIKSYGIENIPYQSATLLKNIYGIFLGVLNIHLLIWILCQIFIHEKRWKERLKSMLLLPISFYYWRAVRNGHYDVVHLCWGHYPCLIALLLSKSKWGGALSMTLTAYDYRLNYGLSLAASKIMDHVFTVSQYNKNILIDRGYQRDKVTVIYGGIDIVDKTHNAKRDENKIVFCGRLIKTKGVYELLDIFAKAENKNITLHIIGDGEEMSKMKEIADNRVVFHGFLKADEVMDVLDDAGVMLHPSYVEMLPNVIKEAVLSGLIVVSSKTHGVDELIKDDHSGFLIDYQDIDTSAQILDKVINMSSDEKHVIRQNAFSILKSNFDIDKNTKIYLQSWRHREG